MGKALQIPKAVRLSVEKAREEYPNTSIEFDLLKSASGSIDEGTTRQMHSALSKNVDRTRLEKSAGEWLSAGGMDGLRFSRRVLRKRGYIRASTFGDLDIASFADLQLGPDIFATIVEEDLDTVASEMVKAGAAGIVSPVGYDTLILLPANVVLYEDEGVLKGFDCEDEDIYEIDEGVLDLSGVDWNKSLVLEDTQSRVIKARPGMTKYNCYETDAYTEFGSICLDDVYLLKTKDETLHSAELVKVNDELGLVFGWGMVSTIDNGKEYFDLQGHSLPHAAMLKASNDFMLGGRKHGEMHIRGEDGEAVNKGAVVFAMPITPEILEAFQWTSPTTGLAIAARPDDPEVLAKFKDGTYRGFSIGGGYDPAYAEVVE